MSSNFSFGEFPFYDERHRLPKSTWLSLRVSDFFTFVPASPVDQFLFFIFAFSLLGLDAEDLQQKEVELDWACLSGFSL